jgi:hypothetical protein
MVWVWPGMLETKVMVAPNSPSALAKASTAPATRPGQASGRVMVRNTFHGGAPRVAAACSRRRSTCSIDRRIARTISGKPITAQASAAPVQRKARRMPHCSSSQAPTTPRVPIVTSNA